MMFHEDYHELPEFLRFNKYGGVLTPDERKEVAKTRGVCHTCGTSTHKVTPFRSIPLENKDVQGGVCLKCHPEQRRVTIEEPPPVAAGGKAAKLLGGNHDSDRMAAVLAGRKAAKHIHKNWGSNLEPKTSGRKRAIIKDLARSTADIILDRKDTIDTNEDTERTRSRGAGIRHLARSTVGSLLDRKDTPDMDLVPPVAPSGKAAKLLGTPDRNKEKTKGTIRHLARSGPVVRTQGKSSNGSKTVHIDDQQVCTSDHDVFTNGKRRSLMAMHKLYQSAPQQGGPGQASSNGRSSTRPSRTSDISKDAWDIVKDMRENPDDIELLTRKCKALLRIGTNQAGSLYEVIEVMRRFPQESSLQIACIGALWSLSADGGNDEKSEILDAGGSEVIIEALNNFPNDVALLSWGLGTLSSFAEGMGGRSYLEEDGIVRCIENILKVPRRQTTIVYYWVFRCLVALICDYEEHLTGVDVADVEEDSNVSVRVRIAIAKTEIIHFALMAIKTHTLDGFALEMAFKFFSHFDLESCSESDQILLMRACEKAIQTKPHSSFPTLHHLACAMVCLTMETDSPDDEGLRNANKFISVALEVVTTHRKHQQQSTSSLSSGGSVSTAFPYAPPHSLEVMVSTLAQIIYFTHDKQSLGYKESKSVLKLCFFIAEWDKSTTFLQGCCCWMIWGIFCYGPDSIKHNTPASKAYKAIRQFFEDPTFEDPALLTVAFAALSEIAKLTDLNVGLLVETVLHFSPLFDSYDSMLRKNACQLLFNLCKDQGTATEIVSRGGLDAVRDLDEDADEPCQMTVNLMIKLSSIAGQDLLSIEDLEDMIDGSVLLLNTSPLAAKSWLSFLTASMKPDREDFEQRAPMAINSIKEVMESFPKNKHLQICGCLALRNMAVSIQKAGLSLDISTSIPPLFAAQKEHGVDLHKDCCDALWAVMGVEFDLEPSLRREISYFAIEVTEIHVISTDEHMFSDEIVTAGLAIIADLFSDPAYAMRVLGEKIVDIIVDVVNTTIYSYLDREATYADELIFEFGFEALRRLSNDEQSRDVIINHGGIVAVIDGMTANLGRESIQEHGCTILRHIAGNDLGMKLSIVEADGVDVIMNIIISHGESETVLPAAFEALSCLCVDASSRNFIAQQGGVMLIANSMGVLSESIRIQETGLAALSNLVSDVDEEILQGSNIISVVSNSIDQHAKVASIQKKGLALLYKLSIRGSAIKELLLPAGCMNTVIKSLQMNLHRAEVVTSALRMLVTLLDTKEGIEELFGKEENMTAIINAMMSNIEKTQTTFVGCKVLNLVCTKKSIKSIGTRGVEAVIYVMMLHYSSEYVQNTGCHILSCSSSDSFMSCDGNFDADAFDLNCRIVDTLVSAMSGFPKSPQIQFSAAVALQKMSAVEENIAILNTEQARLEDVLTNSMIRFPDTQRNCEAVLKVLPD